MEREEKTKNFNMRMTGTMYNKLEQSAIERDISKAQVIRELIRLYVK